MSFLSCAELDEHIERLCNDFPKGGFPAVAFLEKDHTITDFTNATQWNTAISNGTARIIKRIKGNMPEPSEQLVDNPVGCGATQILDGFDWRFEWTDASVSAVNDTFYETLNIKDGYFVFYNCDQEEIRVVDMTSVTFIAKPLYPASNKEFQTYMVAAQWSTAANEFPVLYDAPTGIFE